jgi:hypothetical protein
MASQQISSRHHYVPQFYLKKWASNGKLWQYQRAPRLGVIKSRLVSTKQTGFVERLYSFEPEPLSSPNPDDLEHRLSREEEAKAAPVLNKMISSTSGKLSETEKRLWSRFIHIQLDRDPDRIREAVAAADDAFNEIVSQMPRSMESAIKLFTPSSARNLALANLVAPDEDRTDWVNRLAKWAWYRFPAQGFFITSDQPVLLNSRGAIPVDEISTITMAISPDLLLICVPTSWETSIDAEWLRTCAITFNARLISVRPRYVYSARPITRLPGPNLEKMIDRFLSEPLNQDRAK